MLNQAAGDREILAQHLGISPHQLRFVTRVGEGQGLIFYGSMVMPFVDHFPKDTKMYQIMTTKLLETMPGAEETASSEETAETSDTAIDISEATDDTGNATDDTRNAASDASQVAETSAAKSESKPGKPAPKKQIAVSKKPKSAQEKPAEEKKAAVKKSPFESKKDPDEVLLLAVSDLLPRKGTEWTGTATELANVLPDTGLSPNILTRKLNELSEKLLSEHGVRFERERTHRGRIVKLTRIAAKKPKTIRTAAKKKEGEG